MVFLSGNQEISIKFTAWIFPPVGGGFSLRAWIPLCPTCCRGRAARPLWVDEADHDVTRAVGRRETLVPVCQPPRMHHHPAFLAVGLAVVA